jgi:hypothetical protein
LRRESGLQKVPGIAFQIGLGPSRREHGLFMYLSFEHPFRGAAATQTDASTGQGTARAESTQ